MTRNFKFIATLLLMLFTTFAFAQNVVTGKVIDNYGEPMPEASVTVQSTGISVQTDAQGVFSIDAPNGEQNLVIDFFGQNKTQAVTVNGNTDAGTISLGEDQQKIQSDEVIVVGKGVVDVKVERSTPIAVSTIKLNEIQAKAGNQEFPEIMKNTPSVNVTGQGAGYGDSEIRVRGFDQTNTAYLLNGQPINGMEDGKVYWSNWSGMTDVANAIQIQRGLGASKLAISSVGGTTNIVTKATDRKQGGSLKFTVGNDGYVKTTGAYSTGLSKGTTGFGATVLLSYWKGDGYMDGTRGDGQVYFLSLGYKPNEKHSFNFLLTGAPQKHDQAFNETIENYMIYGKKYNGNYGFQDGEYKTLRRNYYHKPVTNLNWDWDINEKASLSTVLYASWGRGGGTGNYGGGVGTKVNGQIDWNTLVNNNNAISYAGGNYGYNGTGGKGTIIRASVNNHNWYGLVSNFNYKISDHWEFNIGADGRYYNGQHYQKAIDFLGLDGFVENRNVRYPAASGGTLVSYRDNADPWEAILDSPESSQRLGYDYEEKIQYVGGFGQLEYKSDFFSAFVQGALSSQSHQRWDYFQYTVANEESEKVTNGGYNVKGGFSIKPNKSHNFFVNAGYYSKQPFHDNIYLNFGNSVNPLTENEKVLGLEAGYNFNSRPVDIHLNVYRTKWEDRVTTSSAEVSGAIIYTENSGVTQLHTGAELVFTAKIHRMLKMNGFISVGDWKYDDDVLVKTYDEDLNLLSETVNNVKDGKVGGAAQTNAGLGLSFLPVKGLVFDVDYRYYNRLYADVVVKDNVKLPSYNLFDIGLGYDYSFKNSSGFKSVAIRGNINNLFDTEYIQRVSRIGANTKGYYDDSDITLLSTGMFGMGRSYNVTLTLKF